MRAFEPHFQEAARRNPRSNCQDTYKKHHLRKHSHNLYFDLHQRNQKKKKEAPPLRSTSFQSLHRPNHLRSLKSFHHSSSLRYLSPREQGSRNSLQPKRCSGQEVTGTGGLERAKPLPWRKGTEKNPNDCQFT